MFRYSIALLTVAVSLISVSSTNAAPEIRSRFAELAVRILETTKQQSVSVGVFSPTGLPETNSGPGLEEILTDELNRIAPGVVKPTAQYEVKGDYAFARSRDTELENLRVIKIRVRIIDKEFSEDLLTVPLQCALHHTRTVAQVLQLTGHVSDRTPEGKPVSKETRNHQVQMQHEKPTAWIDPSDPTYVSSARKSPYAMRILAQSPQDTATDYGPLAPRQVRLQSGRPWVNIQRNELYQVKVQNRSNVPVAVSLTVDGLDVFHFTHSDHCDKKGLSRFTHFIVHPKGHRGPDGTEHDGTATLVGWFQKLAPPDNYLSFKVTGYGEGAVTKAGVTSRGQVGVIQVQFAHCAPLAEGAAPRSAGNATGFGPPPSVKQKAVRYEIEPPHDFVAVRYARSNEPR